MATTPHLGAPDPESPRWAFGPFAFDTGTGELRQAGELRHLRPQAQQLLALLLSRAGGVVTREELRAAVARGAAHGAFDQSVNDAIREIRIALSDCAERPLYVETLPRRGYRFRAPVRELDVRPWAWIVSAIRSVLDPLSMATRRSLAPAWGRERRSISEP